MTSIGIHENKVWYNKTDLCVYLGVSQATLWRWIKEKKFPEPKMKHIKGGRYDIRMVEAFMRHKA